MGNSSSSKPSTAAGSGVSIPFNTMIRLISTHKLQDSGNYHVWLNTVKPVLICSDLCKFVDGSSMPPNPRLASNPAYREWFVQDQRVRVLLLASLTPEAAAAVVGCRTSQQIWSTLQAIFTPQRQIDQEEETGEEADSAPTFTCELCIEQSPLSDNFRHMYNCFHSYCVTCISSHIKAKIEENATTIRCPALDCDQALEPTACQSMVSPELFLKWCDRLCKLAVSGLDKRYCPYLSCSELILNECNEKVTKCRCPRCQGLLCYECRVPWHAGFRCDEYHKWASENDKEFGRLLEEKKWTRCPECGQPIDLIGGCKSVTCRCGKSFCHKCGEALHKGACESWAREIFKRDNHKFVATAPEVTEAEIYVLSGVGVVIIAILLGICVYEGAQESSAAGK